MATTAKASSSKTSESSVDLGEATKIFNLLDEDSSGEIDAFEAKDMLDQLNVPADAIKEGMIAADIDMNGKVSAAEFFKFLQMANNLGELPPLAAVIAQLEVRAAQRNDKGARLFNLIDSDSSGFIEIKEAQSVMGKLGLPAALITEVMIGADINMDGKVSLPEFKRLLVQGAALGELPPLDAIIAQLGVVSSAACAAAPRTTDRVFSPGVGGVDIDLKKTCLLLIEFQNEFTTEGGKLHGGVKACMEHTGMLAKSAQLAKDMRASGVRVFHAPISFALDGSDNPNKNLGILAGCNGGKLFQRGTWGAAICDEMKPESGDVMVVGKRGLSAFPNTSLEAQLKANGIETVAIAGFMANCCVESTMRDACEKGFNVITLTDCVATDSVEAWKACSAGTYGFFSKPMDAAAFTALVK